MTKQRNSYIPHRLRLLQSNIKKTLGKNTQGKNRTRKNTQVKTIKEVKSIKEVKTNKEGKTLVHKQYIKSYMETLIKSIDFMETFIYFIPLMTTRNSFFIKRMNSILKREQIDILFQVLFEPHSELKSKNLFLLYNIMPDYFKFLDINIITDENKRYYEKITSK